MLGIEFVIFVCFIFILLDLRSHVTETFILLLDICRVSYTLCKHTHGVIILLLACLKIENAIFIGSKLCLQVLDHSFLQFCKFVDRCTLVIQFCLTDLHLVSTLSEGVLIIFDTILQESIHLGEDLNI